MRAELRRVRVPNRDDIGEVVNEGINIGFTYCVAIHFPSTGEVLHYVKERVTTVEDDGVVSDT